MVFIKFVSKQTKGPFVFMGTKKGIMKDTKGGKEFAGYELHSHEEISEKETQKVCPRYFKKGKNAVLFEDCDSYLLDNK
jgi:hypothetical protein